MGQSLYSFNNEAVVVIMKQRHATVVGLFQLHVVGDIMFIANQDTRVYNDLNEDWLVVSFGEIVST